MTRAFTARTATLSLTPGCLNGVSLNMLHGRASATPSQHRRSPCTPNGIIPGLYRPVARFKAACISVQPASTRITAPGTFASGTEMDPSQLASLLRIQNMIRLCKQLRLPVTFKVTRVHRQPATSEPSPMDADTPTAHPQQQQQQQQQPTESAVQACQQQQAGPALHQGLQQHGYEQHDTIELAVVVHVLSDHAFKKYLQYRSSSDLMLLRGMLLKVTVDPTQQQILSAQVQQAFLPKFENEGQDSSIADAIVQQADQRPMVITIKHSGSLVTLSYQGFAAKNSLDNEFTAGAALLLQTHFQRLLGIELGLQRLREFTDMLKEKQLALSFEMVTGCHGHHGQLPAGEYLVTTSAHTVDNSGQTSFLPWQDFLHLCLEWGLPLNDTWIIKGSAAAAAARELLDHMALSGCTTSEALDQLNKVSGQISDQPDLGDLRSEAMSKVPDHSRSLSIHLPGSYPHDQWQGTRIEGYVVSQGQGSEARGNFQDLSQIRDRMGRQVLSLDRVAPELQRPYQQLLQKSGDSVSTQAAVKFQCASWLPEVDYEVLKPGAASENRASIIDLLEQYPVPLNTPATLQLPDGTKIFSRAALEGLNSQELQQLVQQESAAAADLNSLQAMQLLAGPGHQQTSLRYKKKILMWSDTEVGYCMMTFVVRNGLTALRLGQVSYLSALAAMAKNSWGLPQALVEKVVYFGRCWARWIARHGGVSSVKEASYLDKAEAFVQDFLAGVAGDGSEQRPEGAFQGIVMAVDVSEKVVKQLQQSFQLQHILQPTCGDLFFSRSLIREGALLWLPADQPFPKNKQQFVEFIKAAAPYSYVLVQPPKATGTTAEAKKACGIHASKIRTLNSMLTGPGVNTSEQLEQRTYYLPKAFADSIPEPQRAASNKSDKESNKKSKNNKRGRQDAMGEETMTLDPNQQAVASTEVPRLLQGIVTTNVTDQKGQSDKLNDTKDDVITDERLADVVRAVADRFGSGCPPQEQDPAYITCFVALPGIGKSVLVNKLQQLAANTGSSTSDASNSGSSTSVEVLNSDVLKAKQSISGMRYWHQVCGAADSCRGGGHVRLVLADKNLVPAPRDNITRVTDIINKSGATAIAVIPTCITSPPQPSNPNNTSSRTPTAAAASASQQQPQQASDLAFPLELVALCMLRVLQRTSHEGGLDASLAHAMSVVVTFASYFKDMSLNQLKQQLLGCFKHVIELPVAAVADQQQIPAAVLDHVAEGLSKVQINSDQPLPAEWESQMCQLLSDPANAAAVAAIALPLRDCAARLQALIANIIHGGSSSSSSGGVDSAPAAAAAAAGLGALDPRSGVSGDLENLQLNLGLLNPVDHTAAAAGVGISSRAAGVVRYVGVAVVYEDQLRQQLQELLGQLQQQQQQQQRNFTTSIKSDLHVTLWHPGNTSGAAAAAGADIPSSAATAAVSGAADTVAVPAAPAAAAAAAAARPASPPAALMSVAGQEVQMQITALDCSPQVTAAQVELLSGPDAVIEAWDKLAYPHVTLSVAQGYSAVDSNQLPARVVDAKDVAFRVQLQEPVLVVGQVLAFE